MSDTEIAADARRPAVFARLARVGRAAVGAVLDAALPPLCASCRAPLAGIGGLCPVCWSKVSFIAPPYCDRLGIPFAYDPGPGVLSMEAIADPPTYGRARAAVRYDDVARDLVHAPKHTATGSTSPPPWANGPTAPGPASESRQRTTPRE